MDVLMSAFEAHAVNYYLILVQIITVYLILKLKNILQLDCFFKKLTYTQRNIFSPLYIRINFRLDIWIKIF